MPTINDLHRSISEMSEEEIFSHIREIRNLRRMIPERKAPAKRAAGKKSAKKKKALTPSEAIAKMNDAERETLLARLMELKKET